MIKLSFKNKDHQVVRLIDFSGVNLIVCLEKKSNRVEFISPELFNKDEYRLIKELNRGEIQEAFLSNPYSDILPNTENVVYF